MAPWRLLTGLLVAALAAGCLPTIPGAKSPATPTRPLAGQPSPSPKATQAPIDQPPGTQSFYGQVLGLDGLPARGVLVKGTLLSNNGGGILSDVGAGLVSNNGGGLISDKGGSVVSGNGGSYHLLQAGLEAETDEEGRFRLTHPEGEPLNVEAVAASDLKAIRGNVPADTSGLTLQLAYTGSITGKVTSQTEGVSNFEGVDVFIPGTSYTAKADASGQYTLSNVPVGHFKLVASKAGLGRAEVSGVRVVSKQATQAADLVLETATPHLTAITPANAGPGAEVTITGSHFGLSDGKTFAVTVGGATAIDPGRSDDETIKLKIPENATSGDVLVTVGGLQSNALKFTVLSNIWVPTLVRDLRVGTTQRFVPAARDTAEARVWTPAVSWSVTGEAITVDATGLVTAKAPGEATLKATSGSLSRAITVKVHDAPSIVTTIAGDNPGNHNDGYGGSARFNQPADLAKDTAGNLYVADYYNHRVRKVTAGGDVTTLAGSGLLASQGGGFAEGPGAEAKFDYLLGVAVGPSGEVFVADQGNNRIRKITAEGVVSTLAGSGAKAVANGTGTAATFSMPQKVACDADGNVYVTESGSHAIRKITPAGVVTTFAGSLTLSGSEVGPAAEARFNQPRSLAFDSQGNLYVLDTGNARVCMVTPQGVVSALAGGTTGTDDGTGQAAQFSELMAMAVDGDDELLVADRRVEAGTNASRLRKITREGVVTTLPTRVTTEVRLDGPLTEAKLETITGMAFVGPTLYLIEQGPSYNGGYVRRIDKLE